MRTLSSWNRLDDRHAGLPQRAEHAGHRTGAVITDRFDGFCGYFGSGRLPRWPSVAGLAGPFSAETTHTVTI